MPIKKSLRIILILFSIIPALVIGCITYSYVENTLLSAKKVDLTYLTSSNVRQVSSILEAQYIELNVQAKKAYFQTCLENVKENNVNNDRLHISSETNGIRLALSAVVSRYPYCTSYRLFDTDGCVIANSDITYTGQNYKDTETLEIAMSNPDLSAITLNTTKIGNTYILHIIKPVQSVDYRVLGYLCCSIQTSYFEGMFEVSSLEKTGITFLVNKDGTILYSKDNDVIDTKIENDNVLSVMMNKKIDSVYAMQSKYEGKDCLFTVAPIGGTDWFVVIKQDCTEITKGANIILFTVLICSLVTFLLVYFASVQFTKYYTDPIFKLRDTIKKVSNGDFSVRCQIDSKNEIGDLAKSFNKMIQIIQSSYDDLSSMHEQLLDNEAEIRSNYNHIEYLAYHDLLTNLPNKLCFLERIDMILGMREDAERIHAIFFIDLDNFKTINDTLGHDFGDETLSSTGKRLTDLSGERDMVARVGGDEFLVFKYNITSKDDALDFANKLLDAFKEPFFIHGETIHVSLSIGISIYPLNGTTHKSLIKNADIAMYQSKELGKNRVSIYDDSMSEELNHNTMILEVLRTVIEQNEVHLLYQPQVDINTCHIIGYEALMRIDSTLMGPLSPKDFIPIAEESGLIIPLGEWALKEACRFNKSLIDAGCQPCPVSVNISSIQLNIPNFSDTIHTVLNETGLPPQYLALEITESTLISSFVDTASLLNRLGAMGVQVIMDDFGTGYSSLKYLTTLPLHVLKIDKSFIDNICLTKKDSSIAKAIISLAHELGIKVVAEGVEYKEQYELLKAEHCDMIQGFLFSRPLPAKEMTRLMKTASIMNPSDHEIQK